MPAAPPQFGVAHGGFPALLPVKLVGLPVYARCLSGGRGDGRSAIERRKAVKDGRRGGLRLCTSTAPEGGEEAAIVRRRLVLDGFWGFPPKSSKLFSAEGDHFRPPRRPSHMRAKGASASKRHRTDRRAARKHAVAAGEVPNRCQKDRSTADRVLPRRFHLKAIFRFSQSEGFFSAFHHRRDFLIDCPNVDCALVLNCSSGLVAGLPVSATDDQDPRHHSPRYSHCGSQK